MSNDIQKAERIVMKEEVCSNGPNESPDSPLNLLFKRKNAKSEMSEVDSSSPASTHRASGSSQINDNSHFENNISYMESPKHSKGFKDSHEIEVPKIASCIHQSNYYDIANVMKALQSDTISAVAATNMMNAFTTFGSLLMSSLAQANKSASLFDLYPKESLSIPFGCYGVSGINPLPSMNSNLLQNLSKLNSEEMSDIYKRHLHVMQGYISSARHTSPAAAEPTTCIATATSLSKGLSSSVFSITNHHNQLHRHSSNHHSARASSILGIPSPGVTRPPSQAIPGTSSISPHHIMSRKRPRCLPDNQKDQAYWERRRKNNEAAKRCRDARRAKEEEIAIRATLLEQENIKLRMKIAELKTERARLRCMLNNS